MVSIRYGYPNWQGTINISCCMSFSDAACQYAWKFRDISWNIVYVCSNSFGLGALFRCLLVCSSGSGVRFRLGLVACCAWFCNNCLIIVLGGVRVVVVMAACHSSQEHSGRAPDTPRYESNISRTKSRNIVSHCIQVFRREIGTTSSKATSLGKTLAEEATSEETRQALLKVAIRLNYIQQEIFGRTWS